MAGSKASCRWSLDLLSTCALLCLYWTVTSKVTSLLEVVIWTSLRSRFPDLVHHMPTTSTGTTKHLANCVEILPVLLEHNVDFLVFAIVRADRVSKWHPLLLIQLHLRNFTVGSSGQRASPPSDATSLSPSPWLPRSHEFTWHRFSRFGEYPSQRQPAPASLQSVEESSTSARRRSGTSPR